MKILIKVFCLILLCSCVELNAGTSNDLKDSVVRISTTYQSPSFYFPWRWNQAKRKSGQGIVVGKNLVLTLASNVKNATNIELSFNSEPVPVQMTVKAINLNADLALLQGKLPSEVKVLKIMQSSNFKRSEQLTLYWKTAIGKLMEGSAVLDRVETRYLYGSAQSHTVYNVIRSSHPKTGYGVSVFDKNNQFFGLAIRGGNEYEFSIITCNTISKTFDLKKGILKKPTAICGFATQSLTQVYYRQKLGLSSKSGGCLISKVFEQGSGHDKLKKGDVLLSIDKYKLDAWGRYDNPKYGQIFFTHLFAEHFIDEKLPITIMRDKKKVNIDLELSTIDDSKWLLPKNPFVKRADYLIRGGFLFIPMTKTYLKEWGYNYRDKAPLGLVFAYEKNSVKIKNDQKQDIVILSRVLPHPSNIGLQKQGGIINKVNGKPLKSLKQLKEILDNTESEVIKLSLSPGDTPLWLSPKTLKSADLGIQRLYGIKQLEYFSK